MDADADEVRERLAGIRRDLGSLGRTGTEDGWDVDRRVLEDRVRGRDGAEVTAASGVGNPRCRRDLAVLVDHLRRRVSRAACRIEERRCPVRERDAGPRRPVGLEVAEAVRNRLPHPIRVDAGQGSQDPGGGVGDQRRVIVCQERSVAADEVEQVRHLLQVGRDVRVVPPEMGVVELHVDHVFDAVAELAGPGGCCCRCSTSAARARDADCGRRGERQGNRECARDLDAFAHFLLLP